MRQAFVLLWVLAFSISPVSATVSTDRPLGYFPGDPLPAKTVYLTFDDGPWAFTGDIVNILRSEGVRGTFFMNSFDKDNPFHPDTGKNLLFRYSDVLKRLVENGDVIGNHTYSHRDLARLSPSQIQFQTATLERQLKEVLGPEMPVIRLLRPPFGSPWLGNWNTEAQRKKVSQALGGKYFLMMWTPGWDSSDGVQWAPGEWFESTNVRYNPETRAYHEKMKRELARILKQSDGQNGGIILMHDTHPTSRDILRTLIETLKSRGYSFGTLEDYARWRWGAPAGEVIWGYQPEL